MNFQGKLPSATWLFRSKATAQDVKGVSPAIGSADSHAIRYRPDIDGLRCLAVWSVILFHVSGSTVANGYLGVDLFFVISGYLITSIIWTELDGHSFRISRFYSRRIRRILPALLLLLIVVTLLSAVILLPADLVGYGKSLLAVLTFTGNIYFWRDTDYFARSAEFKPLLHLWSLGVEEQFYLLFPFFLRLANFKRSAAALAIALLVVGSFALDVALRTAGGASPAFYLLPTRGWELGLGAFVAVLAPTVRLGRFGAHAGAALGAVLVLLGLVAPLQPGAIMPPALPVTIGAALLIFAGGFALTLPGRLLAIPPLVFFGQISYSLYLWHWPIMVLGRYYLVRDFTLPELAVALALMVTLAVASWSLVERPFRNKSIPDLRVGLLAAGGTVALGAVAALLVASHGFPQRLKGPAAAINAAVDTNYRCPVTGMIPFGASRACAMNLPSRDPRDAEVVLLGNSHAQMYAPLWTSILQAHGQTGLLVPLNGCLPTVAVNQPGCTDWARTNLAAVLALPHVRVVILGLTWGYAPSDPPLTANGKVLDNREDRALADGLADLIVRLERAGKRVILIGPLAEPGYDIASDLGRTLAFGRPVTRPVAMDAAQFARQFGPIITRFATRPDIAFARVDRAQCATGRCEFIVNGRSLFSDDNHVAVAALPLFRPTFEDAFSRANSARPECGAACGGDPLQGPAARPNPG